MTKLRVLLGLVAIVGIATAVFIGGSSGTAVAKQDPPVRFEFSATFVEITKGDETIEKIPNAADITNAVRMAVETTSDGVPRYQIDSFFDVTYRLFGDPDFDLFGDPDVARVTQTGTIDIEIVALSLTSTSPVPVIDDVAKALSGLGVRTEYKGHVTLLR